MIRLKWIMISVRGLALLPRTFDELVFENNPSDVYDRKSPYMADPLSLKLSLKL